MVKKAETQIKDVEWENKLPAAYRTMADGFNSGLTVKELLVKLGQDISTTPEAISHIKVQNFTPQMFRHPALAQFWQTPISSEHLKKNHPSVYIALTDPDVKNIQGSLDQDEDGNETVYKDDGEKLSFKIDPEKPTFETLARLISTQEIGYYHRMAELVRDNLLVRLKNLEDPKFYNELRKSKFVVNNKLQDCIPKSPVAIELAEGTFNVKELKPAIKKAYRPKKLSKADELKFEKIENRKDLSVEEKKALRDDFVLSQFLADPEQYGKRSRDMLRTSILIKRNNIINIEKHKNYETVRNIAYIALKSGMLGIVCDEFVDSVNYPPSDKAVDLYPTCNAKGSFYHAGLNGTIISLPFEIQIPYMRPDLIKRTHEIMELSRDLDPTDPFEFLLQKEMEEERSQLFTIGMHTDVIERRERHLQKIEAIRKMKTSKADLEKEVLNSPNEKNKFELKAINIAKLEAEKYLLLNMGITDKVGALIYQDECNRNNIFSYNNLDITNDAQFVARQAANVALHESSGQKKSENKQGQTGKLLRDTITTLEPSSALLFLKTMDVIVKKHSAKDLEDLNDAPTDKNQDSKVVQLNPTVRKLANN